MLTIVLIFSGFFSNSQSMKDGVLYDTLTTIENDEFIVNQAILAYRDEGYGIPRAEILITLVAKKNMQLLFTKYWFGCSEKDQAKAAKDWGGIKYDEYKFHQQYFRLQRFVGLEFTNRDVPSLLFECKGDSSKHPIQGYKIEYYIGGRKKELLIDKFKFIPGYKLDEYITYRTSILNNLKIKK